jgi:hypothetical protein
MGTKRSLTALAALLVIASVAMAQQGGKPGPGPRHGPPKRGGNQPVPENLHPIIRKMFASVGKQQYRGQRVVEFSLEGERYRNIENVVVSFQNSRTEFAAGSAWVGHIIVENDRTRLHFDPKTNEIDSGPRLRDEVIGRLRGILTREKGQVAVVPGASIAGRKTVEIDARDRSGNVITRINVDDETGLILKRELFDRVGTRVGYFEFTRINMSPTIDPSEFTIKRNGAKLVTPYTRLKRDSIANDLPVLHLPQSSGAILHNARLIGRAKDKAIAQTYMVRGHRLTLVITNGNVDASRVKKLAGDAFNSKSWKQGGATLVLMGDVDESELDRFSRLVVPMP